MAQNNQDEIDLGYLFNKISNLFRSIVRVLFAVIAFFVKYIVVTVILLIVGAVLGYFLDKNKTEVYNNEIIVTPNFESTQYFYDKVDALFAKVKNNDTVFLNKTIGTHYKELRSIEAEPIVDIYGLASGTRERVDLFKVLTDKQDIPEYLKDPQNYQYFKDHHLTIKIKGKKHSEEIINAIIDYFNDSSHYKEYMEVGRKNTQLRITTTELMLSQIDTLIKAASQIEKSTQNASSIAVNDNSDLNSLLKNKGELVYSLLQLGKKKIDEQNIIKVAAINYNVLDDSGIHISNKIKYPIILILLFSGFFFLRHLYRKMKQIAETDGK